MLSEHDLTRVSNWDIFIINLFIFSLFSFDCSRPEVDHAGSFTFSLANTITRHKNRCYRKNQKERKESQRMLLQSITRTKLEPIIESSSQKKTQSKRKRRTKDERRCMIAIIERKKKKKWRATESRRSLGEKGDCKGSHGWGDERTRRKERERRKRAKGKKGKRRGSFLQDVLKVEK